MSDKESSRGRPKKVPKPPKVASADRPPTMPAPPVVEGSAEPPASPAEMPAAPASLPKPGTRGGPSKPPPPPPKRKAKKRAKAKLPQPGGKPKPTPGQADRDEGPPPPPPEYVRSDTAKTIERAKPAAPASPPHSGESSGPTIYRPDASAAPAAPTIIRRAHAEDARLLIADYEAHLEGVTEPERRARLHYEIARVFEGMLGDPSQAVVHYEKALADAPEHLPSIVGARRVHMLRGEFEAAIVLLEKEARLTGDPHRKAALLFEHGRIIHDRLGRGSDARRLLGTAAQLRKSDVTFLSAVAQSDLESEAWDSLARVYESLANAVSGDARHRAALIARRARVLEVRANDTQAAAELYRLALDLDPQAPGALEALKRLNYASGRWRELVAALEQEAGAATDPIVRMMALYRAGRLHSERLGNRDEAIAALERAANERPTQATVLEELARLYEQAGNHVALVETLRRLTEVTEDARERLGILHRIGQLCQEQVRDDDAAAAAYGAALEIDPAYIPALRAAATLYTKRQDWPALVHMHRAEAEATDETQRRAIAYARAAEILETRLGRTQEAAETHALALGLAPDYAPSFKALTRLYTQAGEHRRLVEVYERAIDGVADDEHAIAYLFKIGDLHDGPLAQPDRAIVAYRRILERSPKHLGGIHALQRATEAAGRYKDLVEALEREADLTRDTKQIVALLHRAGEVLDEHLGDKDAALVRYRRVLQLDSNHLPALGSLGRLYHAAGRWEDLVEIYDRELALAEPGPRTVVLLHKTGEVWETEIGDEDRAIRHYRRAVEIDPTHGPALHALSRLYRKRGAWKDLVDVTELERDGFKDPRTRAIASYRAGELYEEQLGDRERALRAYMQALDLMPSHRAAADALARVRTQLEYWKELVESLEGEATTATDPLVAISALTRAGEIWRDHLEQRESATLCYEAVLERDPNHFGALMALEPLYRGLEAWDSMAQLHLAQFRVFQDRGAKLSALHERARVMEVHGVGNADTLIDTYSNILTLSPEDALALEGLERLALRSGDPRVLARIDARLAACARDEALKGAYLTRMGESLEAAGDPSALEVFRKALEHDPESRGAMRGLGRIAETLGDAAALSEAAQREAGVVKDPARAADLLVRSGVIQAERMGDSERAIQDLERALERCPDHAGAAGNLSQLLIAAGRVERLVDLLSQAAAAATEHERISALWSEVAQLHADKLDNLGNAVSALKRLLKVRPDDVTGLLNLARLYGKNAQWAEAFAAFERAVELDPEDQQQRDAHLGLAIASTKLGDSASAYKHFEVVLDIDPADREALHSVAELQLRDGTPLAAVETAKRLLKSAENDADRVSSLVLLARIEAARGRRDDALKAVAHAVATEGAGGVAAGEMSKIASTAGDWEQYVQALERHIDEQGPEASGSAAIYLEIARVQDDELQRQDQALVTLVQGIGRCGDDPALRFDLATRLRRSGRHAEAADELQRLLVADVLRLEAWRHLAQTYTEMKRGRETSIALAPLVVMGEATPNEVEIARRATPRPASAGVGMFDDAVFDDFSVVGRQEEPVVAVVQAMADALGRVYPPDFAAYGLSSRDRIAARSGHPLRMLTDRVAAIFGVEDYELYVHGSRVHGVVVAATSEPSIILPDWVEELPDPQQVFIVAQVMTNIARGLHAVDVLPPGELAVLLAAVARPTKPTFGDALAPPDVFEDKLKLVMKGLPRRKRKPMEEIAARFALSVPIDPKAWVGAVQQTARRIALILCDDLEGALSALRRTENLGEARGVAFVRSSRIVADLLVTWVSRSAMALRKKSGMLR